MRIVILARMTRAFSGDSIKKGPLGGSESALYYLTRELSKFGHRITIFNNCAKSENGFYDGVEYLTFTTLADLIKYSRKNDIDIFISFRDLSAFLFPIRAKQRIWWGHDDFSNIWNQPYPLKILGSLFLKLAGFLTNMLVDKLFVVSCWLADICVKHVGISRDKIWVARNGIDLNYFIGISKKDKYKLIYTSVPDRGLDVLLDIFPKIKEKVPSAKLDVFCGFDLGMLKNADIERAEILYKKAKIPGITLRGNVKQSDLAKELMSSSLFLYPSHQVLKAGFYAETSCIAVLESLAAGTPVIASNRGAMQEAISHGKNGFLVDGDPYSKEYQETFVKYAVDLLLDEKKLESMSFAAKESSLRYSWSKIAGEWDNKLNQLIHNKK